MVDRKISQDLINGVSVLSGAQIPTIQFSTGNAEALQQFSRNMFALSSRMEDRLDDEAEAEAKSRGALDGADGSVELQTYGTIRGRAYNEAAVTTMAATLDTQALVKFSELQEKHYGNPAGFKADWDAYNKGVTETLMATDPARAVQFRNRNVERGISGLEKAKDEAFVMTQSEAEAALIQNETALDSEIKTLSGDLFSKNPDRQRSAMKNLQIARQQWMQIYRAKDPITGKPLYLPHQIAKAEQEFNDKVLTKAGLEWFDSQEDKTDAFQKFVNGEFKIPVKVNNNHIPIRMANQGKIRNKPLQTTLQNQLRAAAAATADDLEIVVHSGGQYSLAEAEAARKQGKRLPRTGSTRHDHGHAADLKLARNGKILPFHENRALYAQFFSNAVAAGAKGVGVDEQAGYLHIGGGTEAAWGYRGKAASDMFLPQDFRQAYNDGKKRKIDAEPRETSFSIYDGLSEKARAALESEMMTRINFLNSQEDRAERKAEKDMIDQQQKSSFDLSVRMAGSASGRTDPVTGKAYEPVTEIEIRQAVTDDRISPAVGEAIIKAMNTPKPSVSDENFQKTLLNRMYNGEDIQADVLAGAGRLSADDMSQLLTKNNTLNKGGGEGMTQTQKQAFNNLKIRLGDTGMLADLDMKRGARMAEAYEEYYTAINDPNETRSPFEIARDIGARATHDEAEQADTYVQKLIPPRFAVMTNDGTYSVDINASREALNQARAAGLVGDAEVLRIAHSLRQWDAAMKERDLAAAKAKESKKGK